MGSEGLILATIVHWLLCIKYDLYTMKQRSDVLIQVRFNIESVSFAIHFVLFSVSSAVNCISVPF